MSALQVRHILPQVGDGAADVLHILGIGLFHNGLTIGGHVAESHVLRVLLRHGVQDQIKCIIDHFNCSLLFSFLQRNAGQLQILPIP